MENFNLSNGSKFINKILKTSTLNQKTDNTDHSVLKIKENREKLYTS